MILPFSLCLPSCVLQMTLFSLFSLYHSGSDSIFTKVHKCWVTCRRLSLPSEMLLVGVMTNLYGQFVWVGKSPPPTPHRGMHWCALGYFQRHLMEDKRAMLNMVDSMLWDENSDQIKGERDEPSSLLPSPSQW